MAASVEHFSEVERPSQHAPVGPEEEALVLQELDRIVASKFFKNANRSRQFLEYVVHHRLKGDAEKLKERTIGIGVFGRDPAYATGEDPVVRVQAGEVRRRLHEYYQALPHRPALLIELQAGSYSPSFHWTSADPETAPANHESASLQKAPFAFGEFQPSSSGLLLSCFLARLIYNRSRTSQTTRTDTVSERFWAPAFATPQPLLICLAKPVVYRPSFNLYQRYAKSHPGTFQTEVERSNQVLPLDANKNVRGEISSLTRTTAWLSAMSMPRFVFTPLCSDKLERQAR